MPIAVTYEQFLIVAARAAALEEIVGMLLAREIAQNSEIGLYWTNRAAIARADLGDEGERSDITPSPVRAILREMVRLVEEAEDQASGSAPSGQT